MLDREGVGQLVKMAVEKGRSDASEHQDRDLRRTWRRAFVGRVLRTAGLQLCFVLTVPRADRAVWRRRRQAPARS